VALLQMITDSWVSQAVAAAARLGIADGLRDGPKSSEELAPAVGADARALYRLLRALTSVGVFVEDEDSRFGLTPLGAYLQSDVPGSLRAAAIYFGLEELSRAWSHLSYSVQTGQPAFDHVFGMGSFEYLERHPETGRVFNEAMTDLTRQRAAAVVAAYDFAGLKKIVDVGGGQGEFLIAVLKAHPTLTGVLFDLPAAINSAQQAIAAADLTERCALVAGDFFAAVPSGGDAYMLSTVIHNWLDDKATAILQNCHRAMGKNGRLLLIERVLPSRTERSAMPHPYTSLADLMMMVIGGQERTEAEFRALYAHAGFALTRVIPTQSPFSVIEGVRM
jgi:ubiquinone/menaquinone biosynthesis C-methylase UbiE